MPHHDQPGHTVHEAGAHDAHAGAAHPRDDVHSGDGGHGAHEHGAHDKHAEHSVEMFRDKFRGTLLLSVPTVVWVPMIQHWFGYEAPGGPAASRWVPAIFGTLVLHTAAW